MSKMKTQDEYVKDVYNKWGTEYSVLGAYTGGNKKISIRHNTCGHVYSVRAIDLVRGHGCPFCKGTPRKTQEQFEEELYKVFGDEYSVIGEYRGTATKIEVKHNKCRRTWNTLPVTLLKAHGCPFCAGNVRKTTGSFSNEVSNSTGGRYELMSKYTGNKNKVLVKHLDCGKEYWVKPINFTNGSRCPYCYGNMKKTTEDFKQEMYKLVGEEYSLLGKYIGAHVPTDIRHNVCGTVYEASPSTFLIGERCPYCNGKFKKTTEEYEKEVFLLVGSSYKVLGEYKTSKEKIEMLHKKCGNTFLSTPNNFLRGARCPFCSPYRGEGNIMRYLDAHDISYEYQKKFDKLVDKSFLSYDFYIPSLNVLIEYQGVQHYQPVEFFGGDKKYKEQIEHDIKKKNYAISIGCHLLTPDYKLNTYEKVEQYLNTHLN